MKELIDSLPENIRFQLELFRKNYKNTAISKEITRAEVTGYTKGLRDASLITDQQRGMLCVYCATVSLSE